MPESQTILAVLAEASKLLQLKGWNKFSMARGQHGEGLGPNSAKASCFCLSGALVRAWRTIDPDNEEFYLQYFEKKFSEQLQKSYGYPHTFTRWNDEVASRREDVVALIDAVIASIECENGLAATIPSASLSPVEAGRTA